MSEQKQNNSSVRDQVIDQIAEGHVKMHSKTYFAAQSMLLVAEVLLISLLTVYVASFTIFVLRYTGVWYVSGFGAEGLRELLSALPWPLVLVLLVCIISLEILLRRHTASYRRPLVFTVCLIFGGVVVAGIFIAGTSLHGQLLSRAHNNALPVVGPVYRDLCSRQFKNVQQGVIVAVNEIGFCIHDGAGKLLAFVVDGKTKKPPRAPLSHGDGVVVFGRPGNGVPHALGVKKLPRDREMAFAGRHQENQETSERCRLLFQE